MNRERTLGALGAVAVGGIALAPTPASLRVMRNRLPERVAGPFLCGTSRLSHVALTFDDGPDVASTGRFLDCLDELDVRATFFVLGRHIADGALLREMSERGHEIGVHGWDHRPAALHSPRRLADDVRRTKALIEDVTGRLVVWYRPPYGLVTTSTVWAARSTGLRTVLWSAWGRDWERRATPTSIAELVAAQLAPGGTVLLHDSDRTSAPGSWRATLAATRLLVPRWRADGLGVGPLGEHWTRPRDTAR